MSSKKEPKGMFISLSRRTRDLPERIDEYADIFGMSNGSTFNHILNDWERLKGKERLRELQGVG